MTAEESIKDLKRFCDEECDKTTNCKGCGIHYGKEALEKQIPKKPNVRVNDSWSVKKTEYYCPNCGYQLAGFQFVCSGEHKVAYCELCSQAIDWDGEEND